MNKTQVYRARPVARVARPIMRRPPQTGAGFWDDVGAFWTNDVNPFLKETQIISKGLGGASAALAATPYAWMAPIAGVAGGVASQFGYGKRRKGRKPGPKKKRGKKR